MTLSRRAFLERLGAVGGYGAVFLGMQAMGLLEAAPTQARSFQLPPGSGRGRSVVVIGGGIAGLVGAFELDRAGWDVTLLEARDRIGGRVWTLRKGTRVEQMGRPDQVCGFDGDLYFDAGAARLPSTHQVMLGYARKFGVPIEVMVNSNRSAKWDFGGKIYVDRQIRNGVRGRFSELLAKSIDRGALNAELAPGERSALRDFLSFYGELSRSGEYQPGGMSGYAELPGGYRRSGRPLEPFQLSELMERPAAALPLVFEEFFDQQAPMFQPVGGMDRIASALYEQIQSKVRLSSPVTAILRTGNGVRIEHGPGRQMIEADFCLCTLPLNLLARVANDFSTAKREAIADTPYSSSIKVAFQSPRFWEEEGLYGGLGWTDRASENLIYPSGDWNDDQGILVAAYCAGWTGRDHPAEFAAMSHEDRFALCREVVEAMHPGQSRRLTRPMTVAWALTPWSEGAGPDHPDWFASPRPARYDELLRPEGPIYFAGEHLSYLLFWQEGAALSAHEAMRLMTGHSAERRSAS